MYGGCSRCGGCSRHMRGDRCIETLLEEAGPGRGWLPLHLDRSWLWGCLERTWGGRRWSTLRGSRLEGSRLRGSSACSRTSGCSAAGPPGFWGHLSDVGPLTWSGKTISEAPWVIPYICGHTFRLCGGFHILCGHATLVPIFPDKQEQG
jgi:hypothetical protein